MTRTARDASGDIVPVRLPDAGAVFARRAARLAALARDHAAGPYLAFLAALARAQHAAAAAARGRGWREILPLVLRSLRDAELPAAAREAIARLGAAPAAQLDGLADALLAGRPRDLAAAPFVGAAVQVAATVHAAGLDPRSIPRAPRGCPVCRSGPVAGVLLGVERLRYLACARCATEWHLARVHCASCGASDRLGSLALDGPEQGALPACRAEACDACGRYVKLLDLERVPDAEPVADDAATLVLDLLVAERGYRRAGPNLLAPAGEPDEPG